MELFNIAGKKAIVTGGTRGLGYGMAEGLMEAGCEVVIVGTSDKVYDVAKGFCDRGFKCHGVKARIGEVADKGERLQGFGAQVETPSEITSIPAKRRNGAVNTVA